MAADRTEGIAGTSTGGVVVLLGVAVALVWSVLVGLVVIGIGLIAFGGFAEDRC